MRSKASVLSMSHSPEAAPVMKADLPWRRAMIDRVPVIEVCEDLGQRVRASLYILLVSRSDMLTTHYWGSLLHSDANRQQSEEGRSP